MEKIILLKLLLKHLETNFGQGAIKVKLHKDFGIVISLTIPLNELEINTPEYILNALIRLSLMDCISPLDENFGAQISSYFQLPYYQIDNMVFESSQLTPAVFALYANHQLKHKSLEKIFEETTNLYFDFANKGVPLIRRILKYLEENSTQEIFVKNIYTSLRIDYTQFCRALQKAIGIPCKQLIKLYQTEKSWRN